jgi:hypothetical protein
MNVTKLSLATIMACAATASFAASDVASAFKEGKLDGRIRAHYFYTDWDKNKEIGGTAGSIDSQGAAIGGSLIYKTAPLYGVSAGVGFYTTQNAFGITRKNVNAKISTAADLFSRGPGSAADFGKGYSVLAQTYLQYDISKSTVKVGRMLITNPFTTPNDTKFIPIAIQGASVVVKDLPDTTFMVDYMTGIKERGMDNFQNMANTADTPDAIKNYYHTTYTTTATGKTTGVKDAPVVSVIGIKNTSVKGLELQGWVMNWPDIVRQYIVEANYGIKFGDFGFGVGGRFLKQVDQGAGDIIRPKTGDGYSTSAGVRYKGDDDDSVDSHMYALKTTASYRAAKVLLAYSHTNKGGDLIAPWRGFPTDGYTRSMTQTDWNANTRAYKGQLEYDFSSLVKGASTVLSYSFYDRDIGKVPYQSMTDRYYGNGDTRQVNLDVMYKVPYVKGLEWKVRTMIQHNDKVGYAAGNAGGTASSLGINTDTSNKELRVEGNYYF